MTFLVLTVAALAAAAFLWWVARGRARPLASLAELPAGMERVDLDAFRTLMDPGEDSFLRAQLNPADYRQVHRLRVQAGLGYLDAVAANAAFLLRLGEAARRSADPEQVAAGQQLVAAALRSRIYVFQARLRLGASWLFPGLSIQCGRALGAYEALKSQAARTVSAHDPRLLGRLSASL